MLIAAGRNGGSRSFVVLLFVLCFFSECRCIRELAGWIAAPAAAFMHVNSNMVGQGNSYNMLGGRWEFSPARDAPALQSAGITAARRPLFAHAPQIDHRRSD